MSAYIVWLNLLLTKLNVFHCYYQLLLLHSTLILHVVTLPSMLLRRKWKWLYLRPLSLFQPVCAAPFSSEGVREGMLRTANSLITPVYTFSLINLTGADTCADTCIIFFPTGLEPLRWPSQPFPLTPCTALSSYCGCSMSMPDSITCNSKYSSQRDGLGFFVCVLKVKKKTEQTEQKLVVCECVLHWCRDYT